MKLHNALAERFDLGETMPVVRVRAGSTFAYDLFLRAQQLARTADFVSARKFYQEAIASDPSFARAYSGLSVTYTVGLLYGLSTQPQDDLNRALVLANKSVMLGGGQPQTHWSLAFAYLYHREFDKARASVRRAIALDPSYADAYALLGWINTVEYIRKARLFDPHLGAPILDALGQSHYMLGQFANARDLFDQSLKRNSENIVARIWLVTLIQLGLLDEAEWEVAELETMSPDFSIHGWAKIQPFKDQHVLDTLMDDFSRASGQ